LSTGTPSWLKYGCLGALVVGLLVIPAALVGLAWLDVRSERVEDRILTPGIPAPDVPPEGRAAGRVRLRIRDAELSIEPAAAGQALRVEAVYDTKSFALEESLDPGVEEGFWTYELAFDRKGRSPAISGLRSILGGTDSRIRVLLPVDAPIELDLAMREGAAFLQLGGSWLTSADIDLSKGGLDMEVEEPMREPMERLSIRTAMGGASLDRIGNASPRRLDIAYSMGGMSLDLTGRWSSDSDIALEGSMGGGAVRLPGDVAIEGLDQVGVQAPTESELGKRTLRFTTASSMGELQFYE